VLTTLVGERERLIEDRREVARAREVLDRSDEAAQAQGDLLAVGGEIDRHVRRYAALITAKTLLEEEVNRYALTHQAPVLAAASRYLERLTGERYNQVRVVGDGVDQVIEVVCAQGERYIEQLSDGTRDQLYLALRLSVLEEHLRAAHALPLIVDDALLTFDDRRTGAALLAFRDFAKLTQVIYFTHHERVLDIARDVLGAEADLVRIDEVGVAV
jgi:DNA repair protein SbcC/Rad50